VYLYLEKKNQSPIHNALLKAFFTIHLTRFNKTTTKLNEKLNKNKIIDKNQQAKCVFLLIFMIYLLFTFDKKKITKLK